VFEGEQMIGAGLLDPLGEQAHSVRITGPNLGLGKYDAELDRPAQTHAHFITHPADLSILAW
jgi:hypothetical protein